MTVKSNKAMKKKKTVIQLQRALILLSLIYERQADICMNIII